MKKLLIGLTVISLLSIASATYAGHNFRYERHIIHSVYDAPVIVKVILGHGKHSYFWRDRHERRYFEKRSYFKHRPYWKRVSNIKKFYRRGYERPYWRHDRFDRYNRYDRYDRHIGYGRHSRY